MWRTCRLPFGAGDSFPSAKKGVYNSVLLLAEGGVCAWQHTFSESQGSGGFGSSQSLFLASDPRMFHLVLQNNFITEPFSRVGQVFAPRNHWHVYSGSTQSDAEAPIQHRQWNTTCTSRSIISVSHEFELDVGTMSCSKRGSCGDNCLEQLNV